ncbi:MAG: DegT/DnrJ/EryC1/StrS family aminotransferase [Flavobacteriales bacterium]|nr:DegT/DnrJ/EryC1/StrS family aminotransferase [Flavobacteriales bacterium]
MFAREKFDFLGNSLSKSMLIKALGNILLFRGEQSRGMVLALLSDFFGVKQNQIFLFSAARMSVFSFIKSLDLERGDEVLVAGYTCVVLTNAVKFSGQPIKYVDIQVTDCNLDLNALREVVSEKSKVLILPHNFGLPDQHISAIKEEFPELIIIEDVAHGFGTRDKEKRIIGTIGDASFFSLEYSKPVTAGLGGIMIINNPKHLSKFSEHYNSLGTESWLITIRKLLTLCAMVMSRSSWTSFFRTNVMRFMRISRLVYATSQKEVDGIMPETYATKLNPLLCNVLLPQLQEIRVINQTKRKVLESYAKRFAQVSSLIPIDIDNAVMIRYPLIFNDGVEDMQIDSLREVALKKGYRFGEWFNDVIHPKGSYRYMYQQGSCPVGETMAKRMLNLPVNAFAVLSESELDEVVSIIKAQGID